MRIFSSAAEFDLGASAVALGTFDGVHLGHQALIRRCQALAEEMNAASVVCTFDRHPLSLLFPERAPKLLMPLEERLAKFEAMGVDGVLLHAFTPEFADMEPEEYLRNLSCYLGAKAIVAGFNYSFGAGGRGNARMIQRMADELGYRAEIVEAVKDGEDTVSSSLIRRLLEQGENQRADRLLSIQQISQLNTLF